MKVFNLLNTRATLSVAPSVCCLGWFDGLHRGHQALIQKTQELAQQQQLPTSVFTLTTNNQVLFEQWQGKRIYQVWQKHSVLRQMGVNYCFNFHMSNTKRKINKQLFMQFLKQNLRVVKVVVGSDFRFGYRAQGQISDLAQFFGQKNLLVLPLLKNQQGQKISSSTIRASIATQQISTAYQQIYEPIIWQGRVIPGQRQGRQIGFPTLNQVLPVSFCLPVGIYFSKTWIRRRWLPSVTCVWQPQTRLLAETFVLNYHIQQPPTMLRVKYVQFRRKFIHLASLTAIKAVISSDVQAAIRFFNLHDHNTNE